MDLSTSECSSGCESGWTMYFDQYSDSEADHLNKTFDEDLARRRRRRRSKEDEDLSMVSDASSGPPHVHEDGHDRFLKTGKNIVYSSDVQKGQHKNKEKEQNSFLDDTASSHADSFSKNIPSFSQGLSATDPKEKSKLMKQFGFSKSSVKGKPTSEISGGLQGRKKW